ncbi:DUF1158 domain-containing protein [Escherichia coli]
MKHPLETLTTAAGILLMAFLSCLLFCPRIGADAGTKTGEHVPSDGFSQLYTLLFCLWFLVLGAIEYFVLRFIWRRWFSLAD